MLTETAYISFNSCMVRFRVNRLDEVVGSDKVSIPVWFDLELFQFLKNNEVLLVSIPVWFDLERTPLKGKEKKWLFQFLYGSI